jgi:hypothetical protein
MAVADVYEKVGGQKKQAVLRPADFARAEVDVYKANVLLVPGAMEAIIGESAFQL